MHTSHHWVHEESAKDHNEQGQAQCCHHRCVAVVASVWRWSEAESCRLIWCYFCTKIIGRVPWHFHCGAYCVNHALHVARHSYRGTRCANCALHVARLSNHGAHCMNHVLHVARLSDCGAHCANCTLHVFPTACTLRELRSVLRVFPTVVYTA